MVPGAGQARARLIPGGAGAARGGPGLLTGMVIICGSGRTTLVGDHVLSAAGMRPARR